MANSRRTATSRTHTQFPSHKQKLSVSKSNALGYAKRQSRKPKILSADDVYEYQPGKSRRSNVRLELDRDESKEYGVGPDGEIEGDVDRDALRARLVGEAKDDESIPSDDDEEIDSDAAFEESDENRFAGFFSSKKGKKNASPKKKKRTVRFADVDLNEDDDDDHRENKGEEEVEGDEDEDEEMEQGGDDEFISLIDVLDGKGEVDLGDDGDAAPAPSSSKSEAPPAYLDQRESDISEDEDINRNEDEEEESASEDKLDFTPSDDEEAEPEALQELQDFISSLDASDKKRKAPPDDATGTHVSDIPKRKKRQIIKERTEAGTENEFRARTPGSKLQLEDLLAPLASHSSALQSLKKSLTSTTSKRAKTLSAPLPQRTQERLDRRAAYEQTKEEVDKWRDTMKHIREAEHLSFPLQNDSNSMGRTSNLELAAKFKASPTTELESSVDALLKSANMRDESDLAQTEDHILKNNKVTLEEVAERRAELRKMRELMFRAELKARRINKIKSKAYRRLKRREKDRLTEKMKEMGEDDEEGEEERLKIEMERARERATLKHKHTGKWAKQMRARGDALGEDERHEMEEMLSRGEKLRRKIKGLHSDESDGGGEDDSDDSGEMDEEQALERIKQSAFDELKKADQLDEQLENSVDGGKKSVFNMKFMKEAMAREKAAANKLADDFVKEMGGSNDAEEDDANSEQNENGTSQDPSSGVVTQRVGGRVVFRPGAQPVTMRSMGSLASDTSSVTLKSTDLLSPSPTASSHPGPPTTAPATFTSAINDNTSPTSPLTHPKPPIEEPNPWLTRPGAVEAVSKAARKNEVVVSKDSKAIEKSKNKLRKISRKHGEEKEKANDDATLEIETEKVLTLSNTGTGSAGRSENKGDKGPAPDKTEPKQNKGKEKGKGKVKVPPLDGAEDVGDDSDAESEIEAQERALEAKKRGIKAFEQRDLVALAFAGDNVVQQFEEAKRREIAADAPKEVDTTLPGWGTWGGTGLRKLPPKPERIKKIAGIDPTTRADYNKSNVIISERRDKKAAKYMVKDLPFPYTSKAQFERSMERPLGTEWNTRVGFQRATLPRVVAKPGVIITPLEKHG
ncbi:hypothetical protein AX17_000099 [Amanita inopinata Kibby_2008]|nr:hypothetical protein AX17_000099 [Amanita inopinata Kibby_2008]